MWGLAVTSGRYLDDYESPVSLPAQLTSDVTELLRFSTTETKTSRSVKE